MRLVKSTVIFGCMVICVGLMSNCAEKAPAATPAPPKKVEVPKSKLTLLHRIQGRWMDNENPEAVIEVIGKKMLWVYQEEVLSEKIIEAYDKMPTICTGTPAKGGMGFFVAYRDNIGYCYQIMNIKDNIFDYRPLGPIKGDY